MYQKRNYRNLFENELVMFDVCVGETDLRLGCDRDLTDVALRSVRKAREAISTHIENHPVFGTSLIPLAADPAYHPIVNKMIEAGIAAGTGPMAAVAGAIAEYTGKALLEYSEQVFVENGGDIFFASNKDRIIGIYAGNSMLTGRLAIRISSESFPLGICTSSGTVGHSFSMGRADAVTVLSRDTALADAVATAAGNMIRSPGDINKALDFAIGIKGITGILAIIGDKLGAVGEIELAAPGNRG
ncbi:MAG: UPF0280 family protein [Clostridia bacterium]|nr:UPF0280 family protein [Clostridia bacterium]